MAFSILKEKLDICLELINAHKLKNNLYFTSKLLNNILKHVF